MGGGAGKAEAHGAVALGVADAEPADQVGALEEHRPGEGRAEQEPGGAAASSVDAAEDRDAEQDNREEGGVDDLGDQGAEEGEAPGPEGATAGVAQHRQAEGERGGEEENECDRRLGEEADREPGEE